MPEAPEFLDLGATRSDEGFFLLRNHDELPLAQPPPGDGGWQFCSTFRDSPPYLREAVLKLIRHAQRKVFVTSFILGDDELIDTLAETARRLTGGVYVISELSEESLRKGLAQLAGRTGRGQTITQKVEAEKKRFMSLTSQGIAVRGHENCHAKFIVVDDTVAWVGSANLETRAFTKVGEVGVVIYDPTAVSTLARLFARMWLTGCRYELPAFSDGYRVAERQTVTPVTFTVPDPIVDQTASIVWTDTVDDNSDKAELRRTSLLLNLQDVIGHAREQLLLATFSLNRMNENPELVLGPVANAIKRGVRVRMLVRAMNERDRHRQQAKLFHNLGVRILADDLNHAKAAVADDNHGMLFSANFDADHGLAAGTGIEVGARLDATPALNELARYLRHAMTRATRNYVPMPTARQLNERLAADWQSPWPHGHKIDVHCPQLVWRQLAAATQEGPVIWTRKPGKPIELQAGGLRLLLRMGGQSSFHLNLADAPDRHAKEELARWMRTPSNGQQPDPEHGFCAALLQLVPDPDRDSA